MSWRITPDGGGSGGGASARRYREEARLIRANAARTGNLEIEEQLLRIAAKYEDLADHAERTARHQIAAAILAGTAAAPREVSARCGGDFESEAEYEKDPQDKTE